VLPHCTDQATPPGATSFAIVALTAACVSAVIDAAGACVKETEAGVGRSETIATAGFDGVVVEVDVAAMATVPPAGTVAGAV
jgi:hypothetical protein